MTFSLAGPATSILNALYTEATTITSRDANAVGAWAVPYQILLGLISQNANGFTSAPIYTATTLPDVRVIKLLSVTSCKKAEIKGTDLRLGFK